MRLRARWLRSNGFGGEVLIETGTKTGMGMLSCAKMFSELHSVELDPQNFLDASTALREYSNVRLWFGDSGVLLPWIIEHAGTSRPTLFWLDAHPMHTDPTAAVPVEMPCPVLNELAAIFSRHWIVKPVILIDDARLFQPWMRSRRMAKKGYDLEKWPTEREIASMAARHGFALRGVEDVIVLE